MLVSAQEKESSSKPLTHSILKTKYNRVVMVGGEGWEKVEGDIEDINGHGKNTINK